MEEIKTDLANDEGVVKPWNFSQGKTTSFQLGKKGIALLVISASLGILTGFLLFKRNTAGVSRLNLSGKNVQVVSTTTEEGIKDSSTFRDTAIGVIQENNKKGIPEGSHILVREGGSSQNVYLTSSVVDLSKYIGKRVQVWGETFSARSAGWLMDVGRVKIIDQ